MLDAEYCLALWCFEQSAETWEQTRPPKVLGVASWPKAYEVFFPSCGDKRGLQTFLWSFEPDGATLLRGLAGRKVLSHARRVVLEKWRGKSFAEVWNAIREPCGLQHLPSLPVPNELALPPDAGADRPPAAADNRAWTLRLIAQRRGQSGFREALLDRFCRRCVVTGCDLVDALEAAHIKEYRNDPGDNDPDNGLLLRADMHTLFDLDLVGVDPDTLRIMWHPRVRTSTHYGPLARQSVTVPTPHGQRPRAEALRERYARFAAAGGLADD